MKSEKRWLLSAITLLLLVGLSGSVLFAAPAAQVIQIKAKKFEYLPNEITLKKGVPVVLELTSLDRLHGFNCPAFGVRADVYPQKIARVRFTPEKAGTFEFHCDNFCGSGHANMTGKFIVTE